MTAQQDAAYAARRVAAMVLRDQQRDILRFLAHELTHLGVGTKMPLGTPRLLLDVGTITRMNGLLVWTDVAVYEPGETLPLADPDDPPRITDRRVLCWGLRWEHTHPVEDLAGAARLLAAATPSAVSLLYSEGR